MREDEEDAGALKGDATGQALAAAAAFRLGTCGRDGAAAIAAHLFLTPAEKAQLTRMETRHG